MCLLRLNNITNRGSSSLLQFNFGSVTRQFSSCIFPKCHYIFYTVVPQNIVFLSPSLSLSKSLWFECPMVGLTGFLLSFKPDILGRLEQGRA